MYNLKINKLLPWIYVILWCGVIFFFSSIPHLKVEKLGVWDFIFRKVAHISEYCILVILILRAFVLTTELSEKKIYFFSILSSILYAISDEIHQHFVPGRNFSVYDILVDATGVAIGVIFWIRKTHKHKLVEKIIKK